MTYPTALLPATSVPHLFLLRTSGRSTPPGPNVGYSGRTDEPDGLRAGEEKHVAYGRSLQMSPWQPIS